MKTTASDLAMLDRAVPFATMDLPTKPLSEDEEAKEIFLRAYALIRDPERWCQRKLKDRRERVYRVALAPEPYFYGDISPDAYMTLKCETRVEDVSAYCSLGAIQVAAGLDERATWVNNAERRPALAVVIEAVYCGMRGAPYFSRFMPPPLHNLATMVESIALYNDSMQHAFVVRAWEKAGISRWWLS